MVGRRGGGALSGVSRSLHTRPLARIVAPIGAGYVLAGLGGSAVFLILGGVQVVTLIGYVLVYPWLRPRKHVAARTVRAISVESAV